MATVPVVVGGEAMGVGQAGHSQVPPHPSDMVPHFPVQLICLMHTGGETGAATGGARGGATGGGGGRAITIQSQNQTTKTTY